MAGATRFAMNGVGRRTVMEIGGWSDGSMRDSVYEHTTDEHMMDVMTRFEVKQPAPPAAATAATETPAVPVLGAAGADVAQIRCTTPEPDHAHSK